MSTASSMHLEDIILTSDGLRLAARMVWPVREDRAPALILCHGFGSCKENHAAFASQAATRGWGVLSFDCRGHSGSEGCLDSRVLDDLGAALDWLHGQAAIDPQRIAVRGSSMGGLFAIHAASQWPQLAACVALNPLDQATLTQMLQQARDPHTDLGHWALAGPGFPRVMDCDLSCWLERTNIYEAVAGIAPRPLLLIHCAEDTQVPVAISEALFAAAGEPKTFWRLEAGDHCFASRDAAVANRTLEWLAAALPAGR